MQDLQQDLGARFIDRFGDATVPARLGGRDHLRGERQQPAGPVRCVAAGDDQSNAAAGAFGEVLGEPIDVAGTVFQSGVHRTHHHSVAQRGEPKVQRGQQIWVWIRHSFSSSAAATSLSQSIALLGSNTAAQHEVLVQRRTAERRRVRELTFLESAVGVQQIGVFCAQCGDLGAQGRRIAVSGATQLDRDVAGAGVAQRAAAPGERLGDPAGQLGAALRGHRVHLFVGPALLGHGCRVYPAVVLHYPQGAVDLLMGGGPEIADRPIKPVG